MFIWNTRHELGSWPHERHWNSWWAWCLPLGFQDGKLLDADPPEELAPKDAMCPSEDGSGRHWTTLGLHGWFVGPAEFSIHFSISRSSWATSCCDLMNGDGRCMETRRIRDSSCLFFFKKSFLSMFIQLMQNRMFGWFKTCCLLNNFTHSPFFCPREVCQSICEAAVAQVLVPSLEDQREARQGWWFQLGAVEKSFCFFLRNIFPMLFFHGFSSENYSCSIVLLLLCPGTTGQHPFGVVEIDATAESKGRTWQKWCEKGDAESGDRNTWNSCKKKIAACQTIRSYRKSSKVGQAVDGALLSRLVEFADMAQRREYAQVGFKNVRNQRDCTTDERNVLRTERSILTLSRHDKFHSTNVCMGWPPWDA